MIGAIRRRDIIAHPLVTVRCYGWRVFVRALTAGRNQTFLSLLAETGYFRPSAITVPELVGRCVELEKKAKTIYESLAAKFLTRPAVNQFFESLARQEGAHAELLDLCRSSASRERWLEEHFAPWRDSVPRLERQMDDIESTSKSVDDAVDALRLVIRLESTELNRVFRGVVTATGSDFVKKVRAFQTAGARHITFICEEIASLEPLLEAECQELRDGFFTRTSD
jgi:rubrerythrin